MGKKYDKNDRESRRRKEREEEEAHSIGMDLQIGEMEETQQEVETAEQNSYRWE